MIALNSIKLLDLTNWLSKNNDNVVCLHGTNLHKLKKIITPGFKIIGLLTSRVEVLLY